MELLMDQLTIRIVFALFICLMLIVYKYVHNFFYPSARKQFFRSIVYTANAADSLHIFARIIGVGIVCSGIPFSSGSSLGFLLLDFCVMGIINFSLFLVSIYIMESIILYNFEYQEEVVKQKNICYGGIVFVMVLSLAMLIRSVNILAGGNIIAMMGMWLLSMVLLGGATKLYKFISNINFNESIVRKSISLVFSYSGFLLGVSIIIISTLEMEYSNVAIYAIKVFLRVALAMIIFPIFRVAIEKIFVFRGSDSKISFFTKPSMSEVVEFGYGVYEGVCFITAAYFTSVVIGPLHFIKDTIIF